ILEIGTHVGASTAALATAADVVTVDIRDVNAVDGPWRFVGLSESPAEMLRRKGVANRVRFVCDTSLHFLQTTVEAFDLIFLDGDHSAVNVYKELAAASHLIRNDGYILLHDYMPSGRPLVEGDLAIAGPYRALRRACREFPSLAVRPLGSLPWPTKGASHATS